jgi:putative ABC transport system permease protein
VLLSSALGGIIVGLVSSTLSCFGKLPHLLSAIITIGFFHGINHYFLNGYLTLTGYSSPLYLGGFLQSTSPEVFVLTIVNTLLIIILFYFLKTQLGKAITVYGNNPHFLSNYRISSSYVFYMGIIIANALAGCSGYLFGQSNSFIDNNMAIGKPLLCITALMLGKILTNTKSVSSVLTPVVGCVSYFAIQQFLVSFGFSLKYFTAVQATLVLVLLVCYYRKRDQNNIDHLGV